MEQEQCPALRLKRVGRAVGSLIPFVLPRRSSAAVLRKVKKGSELSIYILKISPLIAVELDDSSHRRAIEWPETGTSIEYWKLLRCRSYEFTYAELTTLLTLRSSFWPSFDPAPDVPDNSLPASAGR